MSWCGVCLSVCHTFFTMFPSLYHHEILGVITIDRRDVHVKGQGQRSKVKLTEIKTQLRRFRVVAPIWIHIYGDGMMHKAWCCLGEVLLVFRGHPSNFKVTQDNKSPILTRIGDFWTVTPVWINWWLWNYAQSFKQHRIGALLFIEVIHQISRSHLLKNWQFESSLGKITRLVAAIKPLRFALEYQAF